MIRLSLCLTAALLCCAQEATDAGPTSLVILYKCLPEKRATFRNYMQQYGLDGFRRGKESGALTDYRVLFSRYVNTDNWDMMAVLWFRDYNTVQKWKYVERNHPAGLDPAAIANLDSISSYPTDMARHGESNENPPDPVYLAVPYTFSGSAGDYLRNVDATQRPQYDGWIEDGGLVRYWIFAQHYTGGRPWDSMVLFEYRDDLAFGGRDQVIAKVKQKLSIAETEPSFATAREPVIADELTPGR